MLDRDWRSGNPVWEDLEEERLMMENKLPLVPGELAASNYKYGVGVMWDPEGEESNDGS